MSDSFFQTPGPALKTGPRRPVPTAAENAERQQEALATAVSGILQQQEPDKHDMVDCSIEALPYSQRYEVAKTIAQQDPSLFLRTFTSLSLTTGDSVTLYAQVLDRNPNLAAGVDIEDLPLIVNLYKQAAQPVESLLITLLENAPAKLLTNPYAVSQLRENVSFEVLNASLQKYCSDSEPLSDDARLIVIGLTKLELPKAQELSLVRMFAPYAGEICYQRTLELAIPNEAYAAEILMTSLKASPEATKKELARIERSSAEDYLVSITASRVLEHAAAAHPEAVVDTLIAVGTRVPSIDPAASITVVAQSPKGAAIVAAQWTELTLNLGSAAQIDLLTVLAQHDKDGEPLRHGILSIPTTTFIERVENAYARRLAGCHEGLLTLLPNHGAEADAAFVRMLATGVQMDIQFLKDTRVLSLPSFVSSIVEKAESDAGFARSLLRSAPSFIVSIPEDGQQRILKSLAGVDRQAVLFFFKLQREQFSSEGIQKCVSAIASVLFKPESQHAPEFMQQVDFIENLYQLIAGRSSKLALARDLRQLWQDSTVRDLRNTSLFVDIYRSTDAKESRMAMLSELAQSRRLERFSKAVTSDGYNDITTAEVMDLLKTINWINLQSQEFEHLADVLEEPSDKVALIDHILFQRPRMSRELLKVAIRL